MHLPRAGLLWAGLILVSAAGTRADSACSEVGCGAGTCGSSWSGFTDLITSADYPDDDADTPLAFVDPADGSARRLLVTIEGVVWLWDGESGQIDPIPFLDLRARVLRAGERGLLALAVEPDYAESGRFYVLYTRKEEAAGPEGDLVVERYTRSTSDPERADPDSATRILVVAHPGAANHNGGWLAFGPDGMLYLSLGDGGGGCDLGTASFPRAPNGQNPASLLGKLLRLDVRGIDPGATAPECDPEGTYGVPLGNPFAGETAGCGEIWALGLRNPFRFSFDRETGDLWLGDVGQGAWEEVDFLPADYYPLAPDGAVNFGWRCREGCETRTCEATGEASPGCPEFLVDDDAPTACTFPNDVDPGTGTHYYWDPVLCHRNGGSAAGARWQSVIGGYRYRGTRVTELAGQYLYSDAFCDQLWRSVTIVDGDPGATTSACLHAFPDQSFLYSFAEDHLGELYLLHADGTVRCLHAGDGCYWAGWGGTFQDDFESAGTSRWSQTADDGE